MAMKKKGKTESPCLICGKLAPQSICLACQQRIQGEAIEKKMIVEKKGRTDKERR